MFDDLMHRSQALRPNSIRVRHCTEQSRRALIKRICRVQKADEKTDMTKRPNNREVEDEMACPPGKDGKPPRPATEPKKPGTSDPGGNSRP
ncbi:hypothetical protein [Novosphingobium sp.]|uniref:hypothetical protein n=1 Tax=Novosphingobium sp. TaxID=1874826 RepID=UPI003D0A79DD